SPALVVGAKYLSWCIASRCARSASGKLVWLSAASMEIGSGLRVIALPASAHAVVDGLSPKSKR
ncbi:MAG: hypothetical protein WCA99_07095, partial [Candidatus Sulfotelmatobacter sp.]